MDTPRDVNRQLWDEWAVEHVAGEHYDVPGFLAGADRLGAIELEALGDVAGKRLLHLQCHFGMDTLSLVRRGAVATGVDFSPKAIAAARDLAKRAGLEATFVESTVEDLPDRLRGEFDVVFTSIGVLCWLEDLDRWAEVIARFLVPGGLFVIHEDHPFTWIFDNERDDDRLIPSSGCSYFTREPAAWPNDESYAGARTRPRFDHHFEWMHSMSEIVMSLVRAGLAIERFEEHPVVGYPCLPFLVEAGDGTWRTPEGYPDLPLSFTITARAPVTAR
jgi:SAM-dependent methyltransferase